MPSDCDGKILFRVFLESSDVCNRALRAFNYTRRLKATCVRYDAGEESFIQEDEERVKERLKRLGYL